MMKKYLITSRGFYTDTPAVYRSILHEQVREFMPDFVLYRDKTNPSYYHQAEHTVEVCAQFEGVKSFLHQDYLLAKKIGADGIHFTSRQFELIPLAKELDLEVVASTHSIEELQEVQKLGADYATYSPIFATPAKGEPKGPQGLKEALKSVKKLKIFALGGIVTEEHVAMLEPLQPYGFASIRYFQREL